MYKWNAKDYHKSSSQQQKWAEELIEKLKLKGNERVLDIGCGDGKVTAKIAECVPKGSGMFQNEKWGRFFNGFSFPYGFYGVEEYKQWLNEAGLKAIRVELIPKDMTQKGKEGLSGWIRTTWLPYIQRLPEELKEQFIGELADRYIEKYPLDKDGLVHVSMVRLEVEAENGAAKIR